MNGRIKGMWAVLLSQALILAGLPLPAQASREISCESHGMRHAFCHTGHHGKVRLLSTDGFWPCKEGQSWGTEPDGIWVDQGCKGRFAVEDGSGGGEAVVGAAIAVGLLAVLAGSNHKHDEPAQASAVPAWLVGSFNGYNPRYRVATELSVGASGRVTGRAAGSTVYGHWTEGDVIQFDDGPRFAATRTDRGFRLTQVGDSGNIVEYYRD